MDQHIGFESKGQEDKVRCLKMFLILYVDDMLLAGNNLEIIKSTKKSLSSMFEKKDMDVARYDLGVEDSHKLSQEGPRYVPGSIYQKVLEHFQIHNSKP